MDQSFFNKKSSYNYDLPPELIAQTPIYPRDSSRLLVCQKGKAPDHKVFSDIEDYLEKGDVLVINSSRVIPARLFAVSKDQYHSPIELLLLKQHGKDLWECLVKPGKKAKQGREFTVDNKLDFKVVDTLDEGNRLVEFSYDPQKSFFEILDSVGNTPLPPYITEKLNDKERYQTVYAKENGSAAAPTAGLHFTEELIQRLKNKGVIFAPVTLHVGLGTFRPVKVDDVSEHVMHSEYFNIPQETADIINQAKKSSKKVIAVGTTSCRTLEGAYMAHKKICACSENTNIFIKPGYKFNVVDALITNFHLPESTLIMLVCAFLGYEKTMEAYCIAVKEKYRFFSFGDAMLVI